MAPLLFICPKLTLVSLVLAFEFPENELLLWRLWGFIKNWFGFYFGPVKRLIGYFQDMIHLLM